MESGDEKSELCSSALEAEGESRESARALALHVERRFRLLVESVKDYAIFLLDPSGRIATWNTGAQLIKGYSREEAIGRHISIFYTPEDLAHERPVQLLSAAARDGRVEDEGFRVRKDGTRFWADVVITALRDAAGELEGYVKVTRDLTERRKAEEALQQSEESLRATLYSIGDAVLATDEGARVTRINPVAERLTGWSEREAVGRRIAEVLNIVNEETGEPAPNPVDRVLAEGIVVGLANHTALIARDGTERPIADSGAPILDAHGTPRGAVLVFRDITEERRAQEKLHQSEQKLRLMLASVHDYAIFMLDPSGRIASWNPGAERITGYREQEVLGAHFARLFTPEAVAAGKPDQELELAASQGRFEDEGYRIRKDGTRFWANVIITPVCDASAKLVGFVKVTRDLTARRKTEEERIRLAQAQEAIRLRDEFMSIASHELRTPLTALALQLETLRDGAAGDETLVRKLDRALRVSDRLGTLIEDLLDVSRIATGRLKLQHESFDLEDAVREVAERLHEAAARARCEIVLDVSGPIAGRWDRVRIEQVLSNLLSNSFKYAAGRPVTVTARREGDSAVLEVRDSGPGIPENELPRIFERFERAAPTSHYGGLGLGLYVAREIVRTHAGTISAANADDGGARLTVRLPLAPPEPRQVDDHVDDLRMKGSTAH
jgi:PAS domain S-box-containing protein